MPWHVRWRNVFRADPLDEELNRELEFHLAEKVDRLIASGMGEEDARRLARKQLGNYSLQKERTRDMNVAGWLESAYVDVAFGLRQLKLNPGFAAVAILSLALGIGANTAIFQLLDAIRLRGLPVKDPWQLATIDQTGDYFIAGSYNSRDPAFSYAQMEALRKHQQAFSDFLLFWPRRFNLSESGQSRYAEGILATTNYLDVLGITPMAGRGFSREDGDKKACPGAGVLLSYGFWQRQFGGDLSAIGKEIELDGHRFPIGGITPPSFLGVEPGERFDVMLPLCAESVFAQAGKGRIFDKISFWLTPIGRLRPGWTVERASEHIGNLSPAIFRETLPSEYRADFAKSYLKNKLKVVSASAGVSNVRHQYENPLWILLAITGSVLLIACANLANLLLARASAREREIAVRQALGASRWRVILQLLWESLLLAMAGAALGWCLAQALSRTLLFFLNTADHAVILRMGLDSHVFGFLSCLAVATCILFGLAPAVRATGHAPASAMHGSRTSSATRERSGLRRLLVATQVALSLILLVAAVLFSRSLQKLLATNLGFDSRNVLVINLGKRGFGSQDPERQKLLVHELERRVQTTGGVRAAASVAISPFSGSGWNEHVHAGDDPARSGGREVWFNEVSPGYFAAMDTPLLGGRDVTHHDNLNSPKVAVVNEAFARTFFGSRNPVGRSLRVESMAGEPDRVYEIVGLVSNTKYSGLDETDRRIAYLPLDQDPKARGGLTLVVRGQGSLSSLQNALQRTILAVDPGLLTDFHLLDVQIRDSTLRERLMANLSLAFGVLAAALSALGLYGVMSYQVARRRNEIGVRVAIGASERNVYGLIAKDAALMVAAGLFTGIIVSLLLARFAQSMLFQLSARDPLTLVLAAALLAATAAVATYLPARRAAHLDPIAALREE
jgi:putative ABC transport system permease protein